MYRGAVKTITITIPEELDVLAAAEARRRGISKSELIRLGLSISVSSCALDADDDLIVEGEVCDDDDAQDVVAVVGRRSGCPLRRLAAPGDWARFSLHSPRRQSR